MFSVSYGSATKSGQLNWANWVDNLSDRSNSHLPKALTEQEHTEA